MCSETLFVAGIAVGTLVPVSSYELAVRTPHQMNSIYGYCQVGVLASPVYSIYIDLLTARIHVLHPTHKSPVGLSNQFWNWVDQYIIRFTFVKKHIDEGFVSAKYVAWPRVLLRKCYLCKLVVSSKYILDMRWNQCM